MFGNKYWNERIITLENKVAKLMASEQDRLCALGKHLEGVIAPYNPLYVRCPHCYKNLSAKSKEKS